jgi:hypothetical protein
VVGVVGAAAGLATSVAVGDASIWIRLLVSIVAAAVAGAAMRLDRTQPARSVAGMMLAGACIAAVGSSFVIG